MADEHPEISRTVSCQMEGISLGIGVGIGRALFHTSSSSKSLFEKNNTFAYSQQKELSQLDHALAQLKDEIQALIFQQTISMSPKSQTKTEAGLHREWRDILDVYLLLASDPGWKRQLRENIQNEMTALDAVEKTLEAIRSHFNEKGEETLWGARVNDFEDLTCRLKRYLTGSMVSSIKDSGDYPIIVIADRIGPAELLDYNRERLAGLILLEHSPISHVAIVARSLKIPVVGGIKGFLNTINPGDSILVDGNEGRIYIRPTSDIIRRFDSRGGQTKVSNFETFEQTSTSLSVQTRDGVPISLWLNAGLVEDVDHIETTGAEGIGLYRTEIPFMMRPKLPNVAEQTKLYQEILKRSGKHPVVFRTLDVGGDKVLPYLESLKSERLIIHQRTAGVFFDRLILLRYQLRALIRASAGAELRIMLPMIAEVSEIKAARALLNDEIERECTKGNPLPLQIKLGAMIEVPSLVYQLSHLIPHVDFLSVGSNDLFHFFYAIDREHPKLANRYDALSSTFLCVLKEIQRTCSMDKIPLSICGEMAGQPLEALALMGLGYKSFSMSSASISLIKNMIRSLNFQEIVEYMATLCFPAQGSVRQHLIDFAKERNIVYE